MLNRFEKFQCYKHLRIYKWIILLLFITNLPLRKYISLTTIKCLPIFRAFTSHIPQDNEIRTLSERNVRFETS